MLHRFNFSKLVYLSKLGRYDLCSLNSVVAVFSEGVAIVLNFCNLEF